MDFYTPSLPEDRGPRAAHKPKLTLALELVTCVPTRNPEYAGRKTGVARGGMV